MTKNTSSHAQTPHGSPHTLSVFRCAATALVACVLVAPVANPAVQTYHHFRFESDPGVLVDSVDGVERVSIFAPDVYALPVYPEDRPGVAFGHAFQFPTYAGMNRSAIALRRIPPRSIGVCVPSDSWFSTVELLVNLSALDGCRNLVSGAATITNLMVCPDDVNANLGRLYIEGNPTPPPFGSISTGLSMEVGKDYYLGYGYYPLWPGPLDLVSAWTLDLSTGGPLMEFQTLVGGGMRGINPPPTCSPVNLRIGPFDGVVDEVRLLGRPDGYAGSWVPPSPDEMLFAHTVVSPFSLGDVTVQATPITGLTGIQSADLNADGKMDLLVWSDISGQLAVMLGQGDGTFASGPPINDLAAPRDLEVGYLDADEHLDIVALDHFSGKISTFLGAGDGTIQYSLQVDPGGTPNSLLLADVTQDDVADVLTGDQLAPHATIFEANADGSLRKPVTVEVPDGAQQLAVGYVNADDFPDLVAGGSNTNSISVLLADDHGGFSVAYTFPQPVHGQAWPAMALGDVNGDDLVDIAIAGSSPDHSVTVRLGLGDGTFTSPVFSIETATEGQVVITDLSGDGMSDIVVADTWQVHVILGDASGSFDHVVREVAGSLAAYRSLAVGDFDSDGASDLAGRQGSVVLLVRQVPPDYDEDGYADYDDNCRQHANADQRDTDGDLFGNACDPDIAPQANDCVVNALDLGRVKSQYFQPGDLDTDFNGDGITNVVDLGVLKSYFFNAPGHSGLVSECQMVQSRQDAADNRNDTKTGVGGVFANID